MKHRAKKRQAKTEGKTNLWVVKCECGNRHITKSNNEPTSVKCPGLKRRRPVINAEQMVFKYKDKKLDGKHKFKETGLKPLEVKSEPVIE